MDQNAPARELTRWKSHKTVWAEKIIQVEAAHTAGIDRVPSAKLHFADGSIVVDHDYLAKHNPQAGGYYVVYGDGYASFSPAKAFEEGYARDGEKRKPIATVINNNQPGWTNIIETEPHVTIPVGTKLFLGDVDC